MKSFVPELTATVATIIMGVLRIRCEATQVIPLHRNIMIPTLGFCEEDGIIGRLAVHHLHKRSPLEVGFVNGQVPGATSTPHGKHALLSTHSHVVLHPPAVGGVLVDHPPARSSVTQTTIAQPLHVVQVSSLTEGIVTHAFIDAALHITSTTVVTHGKPPPGHPAAGPASSAVQTLHTSAHGVSHEVTVAHPVSAPATHVLDVPHAGAVVHEVEILPVMAPAVPAKMPVIINDHGPHMSNPFRTHIGGFGVGLGFGGHGAGHGYFASSSFAF